MHIDDQFTTGIDPRWHVHEVGTGGVIRRHGSLHLTLSPCDSNVYSDAQISDYDVASREFTLRPPLRMTVSAYSSLPPKEMRGTAGFGFWNHAFVPGERGLRRPQALWFLFAAPPNDIYLALNVPGNGWKAATFDARRWQFLAMLPLALPGFLLMQIPPLYRRLWPVGQRSLGVSEHLLDSNLLTAQHTYTLEWRKSGATFAVDDAVIHQTDSVPEGPLGFIAWIDNQYAIVTPQGKFRFGLVDVPRSQSLVIEHILIEPLTD